MSIRSISRTTSGAAAGLMAAVAAAPITFAIQGPDSGIDAPGKTRTFRDVVVSILNYVLTFVGLIAVVMLIYGGFLYLTSAGADEATKKAKTTILYAIIGIVVIALSFVIVNTVIKQGQDVINTGTSTTQS